MKKFVALLAIVGLLAAVAGRALAAKPLVVLSLTSYDSIVGEPGGVSETAGASEMPTWLASMLKLYAEGRDARGIDASRPWGAAVQLGDGLSAFGFVPITDAEELSWELYSFIESTTDVGDGIYKVTGTEAGQELYAKDTGSWLFVSDSKKTLSNVPVDPTQLLLSLDKYFDVALRFALKNIPADEGQKILGTLDRTIGPVLRDATSDETVEILGRAANALDQAVLGWGEHR